MGFFRPVLFPMWQARSSHWKAKKVSYGRSRGGVSLSTMFTNQTTDFASCLEGGFRLKNSQATGDTSGGREK